jgi:hypothetical protein
MTKTTKRAGDLVIDQRHALSIVADDGKTLVPHEQPRAREIRLRAEAFRARAAREFTPAAPPRRSLLSLFGRGAR